MEGYFSTSSNGLIAGEIGDGSVVAGFKHSLTMLTMSVLLFTFILKPLTMSMAPLIVPSFVYPDEPIILENTVSHPDSMPMKHASVGVVIICERSGLGDEGCRQGDIACELDPTCGMCKCSRTDNRGLFMLSVKAPVEPGDYQVKLIVLDDATNERLTETATFTVG